VLSAALPPALVAVCARQVAYYLRSNGHSVMLCACDTFRSGAVEQLRVHAQCLDLPVFERGYGKDASTIAAEGIAHAKQQGIDVVLVDTAGRMQDNEPLMRALAKLVNVNRPDLVLFVGEALVGNDSIDQVPQPSLPALAARRRPAPRPRPPACRCSPSSPLAPPLAPYAGRSLGTSPRARPATPGRTQVTKFNQALMDLSGVRDPRLIDGIVLTKFDTIDDKVGAAISMVYVTGKPIVFVGIGQTYADIRNLNVKMVVKQLVK
jgi:signal recognition particle receptor subunit alpha